MQEAFREHHGLQCGFCTPGMIMTAVDIVNRKGNDLDDKTIRDELDGNLCRCTGYHNIVKAIAAGAKAMGQMQAQRRKAASANGVIQRKETAMSATGIGASVRRKEDQRFITGKGHYTDDITRPGPDRTPTSCARRTPMPGSRRIDTQGGGSDAGRARGADRRGFAADKIGSLICGWMIHSKDGSPMKMAPHPALAHGKVRHVGDADRGGDRRDAGAGEGCGRADRGRLRGAAGGDRSGAKAQTQGAPQIHEVAPDNTIYDWHLGDKAAIDAAFQGGQARHQARHRQQPPGAERDRAARRDRRIRCRHRRASRSGHTPEPACRAAGDVRLRRHAPEHKLRVIAPDVGGGFGSKIFIYAEEVVCLWASKQVGRPVKWVAIARKRSSPMRTAATMSRMPSWRSTKNGKILACG